MQTVSPRIANSRSANPCKSRTLFSTRKPQSKSLERRKTEGTKVVQTLEQLPAHQGDLQQIQTAINELNERIQKYKVDNRNSNRLEKRVTELTAIQTAFQNQTDIEFIGFIGWGDACLKNSIHIQKHENISQHHALVFKKNGQTYVETLGTAIHLIHEKPLKERLKTPATLAFFNQTPDIPDPLTDQGRVYKPLNPGVYRAKLDDQPVDVIEAPLSQVRVLQLNVKQCEETLTVSFDQNIEYSSYQSQVVDKLKTNPNLSYIRSVGGNFSFQQNSLQTASTLQLLLIGKPDQAIDLDAIKKAIEGTFDGASVSSLVCHFTEFEPGDAYYMNKVMCGHCMSSLMKKINTDLALPQSSPLYNHAAVFYFDNQISPSCFQPNKDCKEDNRIGLVYQVPKLQLDKLNTLTSGGKTWNFVANSYCQK